MPKLLKRTNFGNPVLRRVTRRLSTEDIRSDAIQRLIADMFYTLDFKKYGVGLAAPQIGEALAISVVHVQPMPWRPQVEEVRLVLINPEIVEYYGRRTGQWEGCISFCGGQRDFPYAKAMRYKRVRVRYLDETGDLQERDFDGLLAQIMQHETDHLNGILFVDHVKDNTTFISASEYTKQHRYKHVKGDRK